MAISPLDNMLGIPGTTVCGFMAGACMMRRDAFIAAGGYQPQFFIGAEELLLAMDLMSAGWAMGYVPEIVVHHHPSSVRDVAGRRSLLVRNALWCAWLRRPWPSALRETRRLMRTARTERSLIRSLAAALRGLPWVLRQRRVIPPHVEDAVRCVTEFYSGDGVKHALSAR